MIEIKLEHINLLTKNTDIQIVWPLCGKDRGT